MDLETAVLQSEVLARILIKGIQPHSATVRAIWKSGQLPVFIFEHNAYTAERAEELGYEGAPVFGVERSHPALQSFFKGDAEREWLDTLPNESTKIHIYVVLEIGNLCMTWNAGDAADPNSDVSLN